MNIAIAELSQKTRIKIPTIRYYERTGLLPVPSRTEAGHRRYNLNDVARLQFLRFAHSVGLDTAEIKAVLEMATEGNCEELEIFAEFIKSRIEELICLQHEMIAISVSIRRGELDEQGVIYKLSSLTEVKASMMEGANKRKKSNGRKNTISPQINGKRAKV